MCVTFTILFFTGCKDQNKNENVSKSIILQNLEYYDTYAESFSLEPIPFYMRTFSDSSTDYQVATDKISSSKYAYTLNLISITPVVDLKKAGVDTSKLFKEYFSIYSYSDELKGKREAVTFESCIDQEDNKVKDGFVMLIAEYELYNIQAKFDFFEQSNLYYDMRELPDMDNVSGSQKMISQPIYIDEYETVSKELPWAIEIPEGESRKIHVGYIVFTGEDVRPCSNICIGVGSYTLLAQNRYQNEIYFGKTFDLSSKVNAVLALK